MHRHSLLALSATLLLALASPAGAAPKPRPSAPPDLSSPAAALAEAQRLATTDEGKAYTLKSAPAVRQFFLDAFYAYSGGRFSHVPPYRLDVVLVVAADGRIEREFHSQEHPFIGHLRAKLPAARLPPPPRARWLIHAVSEAKG